MFQVIAHRGARSLAPENTLMAAKKAFELGAHLWETDVQQTRDGHLILYHDQTLKRCTNVETCFPDKTEDPVSAFTLEQIKCLDAGSYFIQNDPFSQIKDNQIRSEESAQFAGQKVPDLDEALALTKELNWTVNLELKTYDREPQLGGIPGKTLETVERSGINKKRVVISSFYHTWLDWIRENDPQIKVQALVGEKDTGIDFEDFRFDAYNVNADLVTKNDIRLLKKKGKKINLFTVNDPDKAGMYQDLGIDGIFSDFPQRFLKP